MNLIHPFSCRLRWLIPVIFVAVSCSSNNTSNVREVKRRVLFEHPGDSVLSPGASLRIPVDFGSGDDPVKQTIRITGYGVYPKPFTARGEGVFRDYAFIIDDHLDTADTRGEKYSLVFTGDGEELERNAFYRLSRNELNDFLGRRVNVSIQSRASGLEIPSSGYMVLEMQIYTLRPGIHPDDIYDDAQQIETITVPGGSYDWKTFTGSFELPGNTACVLFRIGSRNIKGECRFVTPYLESGSSRFGLLPFRPYIKGEKNWIGEHLSSKEWPVFDITYNGKQIFSGKVFDRASDIGDFEVDIPEQLSGKGELLIKLGSGFPARYPYAVRTVELLEKSARDFEIVAIPRFIVSGKQFAVLAEINKPGTVLNIGSSGNLKPTLPERKFDKTGLYAITFNAPDPGNSSYITISDGKRKAHFNTGQIVMKSEDSIYISTSDDIYIDKNIRSFNEYLTWYVAKGIGNAFCWRPSEQWSYVIAADRQFYEYALNLLKDLKMPYSLMIEGRTIAGRNINPEESWMKDPLYMGRQAHENDGGYYYWGHFKWEWLHSDLSAKYRPTGGIFARNRPLRTADGEFIFYDPFRLKNMEEGPLYFIDNLRKAKGESTRHTGPSTMFRYLLQAGYDWVGAEQMYGPEETIMSSIRGASRAYGKKDFGTHLATQWASGPYDAPNHSNRLFLSLAISYMHGASHINTEDGLWNTELCMERYSKAGQEHIDAQRRIYEYILTHTRRGEMVTPVAVLQGRNDAWKSFGRTSAWSQQGDEWKFGPAEESFDLLNVFYPGNKLEPIYKFPVKLAPQGWYTETPYGPVDLLPLEAPANVLSRYRALAFLGWNSFDEQDFTKLLEYVKNGGTLLLSGAHLNTDLKHNATPVIPRNNNTLTELIGDAYSSGQAAYEKKTGKGRVIFFPGTKYPIEPEIKKSYSGYLKLIGDETAREQYDRGWIESSPSIEFAAWDDIAGNRRTIYLLNIDWWSDTTVHTAKLRLGEWQYNLDARRNFMETVTISGGVAVMPSSMTTDIIAIKVNNGKCFLTLQCTEKDTVQVFAGGKTISVAAGKGISEVEISI